jgi:hypothetical protein
VGQSPAGPTVPPRPGDPRPGGGSPIDPYPGAPYGHEPIPRVPYPTVPYPTVPYTPAGGYPLGTPIGPAPRRRRTGLLLALVAAGLAVAVLLGIGSFIAVSTIRRIAHLAPASTSPEPAKTASLHPSLAEAHFTGDLRDLLLQPPPGTNPMTLSGSSDGHISLNQYAATFYDKQFMSDKLETLDFQSGAEVRWRASDGTIVDIVLVQLGDATKANSFIATLQFGDQSAEGLTTDGYFAGIPLGRYFVYETPDTDGYVILRAAYTKNDIAVDIAVQQRTKPRTAPVITLCQDQFARLP